MAAIALLSRQYSHSSIKASTARVDEATDHGVEDEGQDLTKIKENKSKRFSGVLPSLFFVSLFPG